jgi:hypothetical protein
MSSAEGRDFLMESPGANGWVLRSRPLQRPSAAVPHGTYCVRVVGLADVWCLQAERQACCWLIEEEAPRPTITPCRSRAQTSAMALDPPRDDGNETPGLTGLIAGSLGGVVMLAISCAFAAAFGPGASAPVRLIGVTAAGTRALTGGSTGIWVGLFIHAVASLGFGVHFAVLLPRQRGPFLTVLFGAAYGAITFVAMTWFVLPWANPVLYGFARQGGFAAEHLVYGGVVALVVHARRRGWRAHAVSWRRQPA